ncbi:hypothetical protein ONZ43_g943 [Nemania bipapillata]|uniref:Uncharacterized protein n=1 Tax=Nemania bipapillata TaxID=110536 RepID=A0ACC2J695_9PEZI|nr:hypothetical protein ONZ43_g943 [Nemania bipapillata]
MGDVAVIGFSFKLPEGVDHVSSFWETLENGRNLMTEWPASRINGNAFHNAELATRNKLYARGGYFIKDDPGAFDAPFFSVTAAEAASMDPMQRWTLEASYKAFENAGVSIRNLKRSRTAVFSASMTDDYSRMVSKDPEMASRMAITGTFSSILPNRVSWFFDLLGPSVHIDTACSSSLVAVDLACQSLASGDASMALVTGSNLILGPDGFLLLSNLNFLSPDSKSYSFDHRANGYARGEGVIALVLKPLRDAVRDGDMIRTVIRSTGTNQDGRTPSMTQPSPEAQEDLIRQVYRKANLSFEHTRYVEAHGTGTPVGDPIEMKAIGRVFRPYRSPEDPLYVGSVKANIGHLEVILEKGIIVPNALFQRPNDNIDVEFYHTVVPSKPIPWPSSGLRRVSVNSFGFGGTNTHVILDDAYHYLQEHKLTANHCTTYTSSSNGLSHNGTHGSNGSAGRIMSNPRPVNGAKKKGANGSNIHHALVDLDMIPDSSGSQTVGDVYESNADQQNGIDYPTISSKLLVWSASDEQALRRTLQQYESYIKADISGKTEKVNKLAYTLASRRSHMLWRAFSVTSDDLSNPGSKLVASKAIRTSAEVSLAFVFTGQGAQYVNMGLALMQYPIYTATLRRINNIYHGLGCEWSIFDQIRKCENIDRPEYSQPLSTALQIALVELLKSFGVSPKAVVGHSSGEIAAAYTTGSLTLQSACKVSYFRGQLAGRLKAKAGSVGAMISVNLPQDQVNSYLKAMGNPDVEDSVHIALRESISGDFLGWRFHDWNPLEPRWRNLWSVETTPWIGDHVVSNTIIYPAAGMLIMAMEAAREMAIDNRIVSGYYIKEAHFLSPIVVKEAWEHKTETMLHLRPIQQPYEKQSTWSDIKLFARYDDRWNECFRATIQIQYEEQRTEVDNGKEKRLAKDEAMLRYKDALDACTTRIGSRAFYKDSDEHGIKYGEWFQILEDIRCDGVATSLARVDVTPKHQASLVHPAVLDAAFHVLRVSITKGLTAVSATHVPMSLHDGWFSASGWQASHTTSIRYLTIANSKTGQEAKEGTIYALADDDSVLCKMRRLVTAQVSKDDTSAQSHKKLLYGVEWQPQLSLLDTEQLHRACGSNTLSEDEESIATWHDKLTFALNTSLCRTLEQLTASDRLRVPGFLTRHISWMEHQSQQILPSQVNVNISDDELEVLLEEIETLNPPWKLFTAIVRQLKRILVGEIDPLSVIFDSNLAEIFYADMFKSICDHRLQRIITLASHENPQLRILEVGAGTGGMTWHILSTLMDLEKRTGGLQFANYTYTDVSPTFFENAKTRWHGVSERMVFKIFDLERAVEDQGFELGSYDLVIAGSVLHATTDLGATIRNVHKTLKPGGRMVLLEAVAPEKIITNYAFGLAPGWWNCQETWRAMSPAIVEGQWHECLQANGFSGNDLLSLLETDKPMLATIAQADFQSFQYLVKTVKNLLWVSAVRNDDSQLALYAVAPGFWRSIRTEATEKRLVTLSIERDDEPVANLARYVAKVLNFAFKSSSTEVEFVVRHSEIITSRDLESLEFVEDPSYRAPLGPRDVEIAARAWGLNFRDVYVALGRLDDGDLGGDCAGIVTRVGSECNSGLQPGDKVCMISPGCMRAYPRALESSVLKLPDDLSFEAAASMVAPGITAYYSLVDVARLRKGEKILIHSAAGSTGQMAIWIAKLKGAEIFATVGFDEKKKFLMEQFDIAEDHIFYSRNTSFAKGIMRVTKGYGVDVVLNSLSGDGLRASWECIAPYGRFIEIGKADIMANSSLPMACFAKNVSFSAVDLVHLSQSDEELTARLLKSTLGLLEQGARHPSPLHVYPVSKVEDAFRYLQSGKNTGRIVIGVNPTDKVPQRVVERKVWRFDSQASYVIAGGFGGLGRAIIKWMVDRGAKNIIILSKSGAASEAAVKLVSDLTEQGVIVHAPKCDASSVAALASVLGGHEVRAMPPIKGCINAAMVLQDAVFENMTYEQWTLTINSKVQSSWNLHNMLPGDLDFFVLLSSLAGICGTVAQSNYAGGCSAQDALARYRTANGKKAVSFDVGWMRNIGIIAEKESYQRNRQQAADMQQIDDTELLALLSFYCDPELPLLSEDKSQILIGLLTPADFLLQGQTPPQMHDRPFFGPFSHVVGPTVSDTSISATENPGTLFRLAKETDERIQIVIRALATKLARAMSILPDDVEPSKPLSSYGVDSLMAVELRNYIGREFQATVAVFDIMGGVPISSIGDLVVERSSVGKEQKTEE